MEVYTEVSSRIGFLGGFKAPEIDLKKEGSINQYIPLFFNRFAAAFNPAKKPILELTSVYPRIKKLFCAIGFRGEGGDLGILYVYNARTSSCYPHCLALQNSTYASN